MSLQLKKVKDLVTGNNSGSSSANRNPEIGFKVAYSPDEKQLKIKIISARHLPSYYGSTKAQGFLTKVELRILIAPPKHTAQFLGYLIPRSRKMRNSIHQRQQPELQPRILFRFARGHQQKGRHLQR